MTEQYLMSPDRQPSLAGVERAAEKIAAILPATPLLPLDVDGKTIWCKAECLQPIGAFKIRGGWHRLTDLTDEQRSRGVVAFSSGNHAQGVAWAARKLGVHATIIMPEDAPQAKLENTRALGADIITYDRMSGSREQLAADFAEKTGAVVVPSFDDPWIVEGQVSCGGGGLASGTALANPDARMVVVEPEGWDDMKRSLELGTIVPVDKNPPATECDALQTMQVAQITFDILRDRNALGLSVSRDAVHHAMRVAFEKLHLVVEPGGAVALAAILAGKVALTDRTAITLSGGNVDRQLFANIIAEN